MSTSDKLALAALVVSLAALLVSLAVGAWEVVKFWREGARVRVRMLPGVFDDDSLATRGHPSDGHPRSFNKRGGRFDVEVARIEVENRGRSPVTIQSVELDLGRHKRWSLGRRTVMFPLLEFDDFETRGKVRLEPYDSATFMVNMNHALWAIRRDSPKRVTFRASARVVGYRTVRSSWLKRWRFAADTPPRIWLDEPFDLAREIFRFLYKNTQRDSILRLALPDIAMKVAEHVEMSETVTRESIEDVLVTAWAAFGQDEFIRTGLWAHDLSIELGKPHGPFDGSYAERRRLARGLHEEPTDQPEDPGPSLADETVAEGQQ